MKIHFFSVIRRGHARKDDHPSDRHVPATRTARENTFVTGRIRLTNAHKVTLSMLHLVTGRPNSCRGCQLQRVRHLSNTSQTLTRCWSNIGPKLQTVAQYRPALGEGWCLEDNYYTVFKRLYSFLYRSIFCGYSNQNTIRAYRFFYQ